MGLILLKIAESLYISEQVVLEIGKFAILWNIFEKERCGTQCNETKLLNLGSRYESDNKWHDLAHAFAHRACLLGTDTDDYVRIKLSLGRGTQHKEKIINFINSAGESELSGGLIAIYRVRNNMFHGLKDYVDLENQIELFRCINNMLENLV